MKPEYIAKKSALKALTPLRILFFWLIIPLFVIIVNIIRLKCESIEFYADKVVQRKGIIFKSEKRASFNGVMGISINQSLFGRMFNFGDVHIDIAGRWDVTTDGIKNPYELQNYLETRLIKTNPTAINTLVG